jgi:hypothetical protein
MQNQESTATNFLAFASAIRQAESTDDYGSLGPSPKVKDLGKQHFGAYQMGYAALADAGFVEKQDDVTDPKWTAYAQSLGVASKVDFLKNKAAQDVAFKRWMKKNDNYLQNYKTYIGQTIHATGVGDVYITESGLLAVAHLLGHKDVEEFLKSGGKTDQSDDNNIHVSEYMAQFAGYGFTYDDKMNDFVDTKNESASLPIVLAERSAAMAYRAAHSSRVVRISGKKIEVRPRMQKRSFAPSREKPGTPKAQIHSEKHANLDGSGLAVFRPKPRNLVLASTAKMGGAFSIGARATGHIRQEGFSRVLKVAHRADTSSKPRYPAGWGHDPAAKHGDKDAQEMAGTGATRSSRKLNVASRSGAMAAGFAPIAKNGAVKVGGADQPDRRHPSEVFGTDIRSNARRATAFSDDGAEYKGLGFAGGMGPSPINLAHALDDYFNRQARLPPSGAAAFDPLLTPVWAGLKLPV